MTRRTSRLILIATALLAISVAVVVAVNEVNGSSWQKEFGISDCSLQTTGRNTYFIMEPGFRLELAGDGEKLHITVLDETRTIDGIATRVVEEREWKDGELYEISRNFFAMCEKTKDVFYFGEEVDFYENGKIVKHDGAWLAGKDGNKAGLIMSGAPKVGMKYYQEIASGVAMDRAEIISLDETCETPAGRFSKCLKIKEGTALNIFETEYKYYAPGIGLISDADMRLTRYGPVKEK